MTNWRHGYEDEIDCRLVLTSVLQFFTGKPAVRHRLGITGNDAARLRIVDVYLLVRFGEEVMLAIVSECSSNVFWYTREVFVDTSRGFIRFIFKIFFI